MRQPTLYILLSLKDKRTYVGYTNNLEKRINEHDSGKVKATKYIQPTKLEFFQEYDNVNLARKVERRLKRFKRRDFIEKIIKDGMIKTGP